MKDIVDIPISELDPHPENPRGSVPPEEAAEMGLSILLLEEIIQPLIAVPKGGRFQVVDGHLRLAGATYLIDSGIWPGSWPREMPVIVRDLSPERQMAIMLASGAVRYSLNPVDEGFGYQRLMKQKGFTRPREVADFCGVPVSRVKSRLTVISLAAPVIEMFREKKLPLDAATHLAKIKYLMKQIDLAETLISMDITHSDAIAAACDRVAGVRKKSAPKEHKTGSHRWKETGARSTTVASPAANGLNGKTPAKGETGPGVEEEVWWDRQRFSLAELKLEAVMRVCSKCGARSLGAVIKEITWGQLMRASDLVCDECNIVLQYPEACDGCPLSQALDNVLKDARPDQTPDMMVITGSLPSKGSRQNARLNGNS